MKYTGLLICICLMAVTSYSQGYILNSSLNGQTKVTCSGTFYDSNPLGNYGDNEDYTVTFQPGIVNNAIRMQFNMLSLAAGDSLIIYDGPNAGASILTILDFSTQNPGTITARNAGGSMTVRFISDNAGSGPGWQAFIRCAPLCQAFTGTLSTIPAPDANGVVSVCLGEPVTLTANMTYPNTGSGYTQSDAWSTFRWHTGFSSDTFARGLTTFTKQMTQHGGFRFSVTVVDSNGCAMNGNLQVKVRTSAKPTFNIAQPDSICPQDTTNLSSLYQLTPGSFLVPPFSGNALFLPDGVGITYTDTIRITDFAPSQTLTNLNDFLGVFMKMEHSYLGDLEIQLQAPNGTVVTLKQYPGGNGCFMGEPVDDDGLPNVRGVGYQYGFTPTPTYGTMVAESNSHTHTFVDAVGVTRNNAQYLPAGNYTSFNSLNALLGTSLNGTWVLKIKDNLASDNGYIFNWNLSFARGLYPNIEMYTIGAQNVTWLPTAGLVSASGSNATVSPYNAASANYTFRIVDSASCVWDTIVKVPLRPSVLPNLGADKILCPDSTLTLRVLNADTSHIYTWNTGSTGTAIATSTGGVFTVSTVHTNGCKATDSITVIADPGVTLTIGSDTLFCATNPNVLQSSTSGNVASYLWNTGNTTASLPLTTTGTYWLQVTSDLGCKNRDTIIVTANPINNWKAPNDTTVCGDSYLVTLNNYPSGTSFTWDDGVTTATHLFNSSGTYAVMADYIGCEVNDTIELGIHPFPSVNLGNDTMFCASAPNELQSVLNGNISSLEWNTGATTPTLAISTTGTYWLEATTAFGCKHRDTINVINNPINNWQTPADTSICYQSAGTIELDNYPPGTSFTWFDGNSQTKLYVDSAGTYSVTADYIGCIKQDDISISIRPLPVIEVGKDTSLCFGFNVPLKVSYPGASYIWSSGKTDSSIVTTKDGTYWVKAIYNGCEYTDSMTVTWVDCSCNPWVANAFSPNGDGYNDQLSVHIECLPLNFQFSVYDRYGRLVFKTDDMNKTWDGKMNGKDLPVGTYYYLLTYFNESLQHKELYKGYVVMLK